ncbi:hypothetical protein PG985_013124 [Apiospora marii]|uniref:uncharacterized protein n=1 Tax=Apiospora marii TaxID=335849 RepID=UPI003130351E
MLTVRFLVLALAGAVSCLGPRHAAFTHDAHAVTHNSYKYGPPVTSTTSSPLASPTGISISTPDDSTTAFMVGALVNERAAGKAEKCKEIDQGAFVERTVRFLSNWKPDGGAPVVLEGKTTTAKQMLERLVQYQDVYRIISSGSSQAGSPGNEAVAMKSPDNIVGEIREMKSIIDDRGDLEGR